MNGKHLKIGWVDIETTGLDPLKNTILEVAIIITDGHLNILEEAPPVSIWQPEEVLVGMDDWCFKHHGDSGLIEECMESDIKMAEADKLLAFFVEEFNNGGNYNKMPMGGSSVHFDRMFIQEHMPKLFKAFHYRNIDVSTIYELSRRWYPDMIADTPTAHRALDDIRGSINFMKGYRDTIFVPMK